MSGDGGLRKTVQYLRERSEVSSLYVFGSRFPAQAGHTEAGLGVLLDDKALSHVNADALAREYTTYSSGLTGRPLNIVVLNSAAPPLAHHILCRGAVIFERNRDQRVRFAEQAINSYLDSNPARISSLEELAERLDIEGLKR